jgi:hypothetical protein
MIRLLMIEPAIVWREHRLLLLILILLLIRFLIVVFILISV